MINIESSSDSDADTSFESFAGDLVIEKCTRKLMTIPKGEDKQTKAKKLDKSKAIKKDKKKGKK